MKILLSAYACEPGKGSEPGVGWHWALEMARAGHEVWIITRANNRTSIKQALAGEPASTSLHFVYHDLGPVWLRLKRLPLFINLYYAAWQRSLWPLALALHRKHGFDAVQHVTFGVHRTATPLVALELPTVFGPVGGAERTPDALLPLYGVGDRVKETLRDWANSAARVNMSLRRSLARSTLVLAKTPETARAVRHLGARQVRCQLEIGIDPNLVLPEPPTNHRLAGELKLLFVGRFIYWKGGALALRAFARTHSRCPGATLTMVGKGPDALKWRALADRLGIAARVNWIPWVTQSELRAVFAAHDLFLFPSLHDSSGNVVLEALANGLPVICLDVGGPAQIVDPDCAKIISTNAQTLGRVEAAIAEAVLALALDCDSRRAMALAAIRRARALSWTATVASVWSDPGFASWQCAQGRVARSLKGDQKAWRPPV